MKLWSIYIVATNTKVYVGNRKGNWIFQDIYFIQVKGFHHPNPRDVDRIGVKTLRIFRLANWVGRVACWDDLIIM